MSASGELLVKAPAEFRVNVAEYRIAREHGVITTFGLGSCIAIIQIITQSSVLGRSR